MKRALSFLLSLLLAFAIIPTFAETVEERLLVLETKIDLLE